MMEKDPLQPFFEYLHKLRASKKVEMIEFRPRLLKSFPNLSTEHATAIVNLWLLENPYKYLER